MAKAKKGKRAQSARLMRELRVKTKLTQVEFANLLGSYQPTIANYERGVRIPDIPLLRDRIIPLAAQYGMELKIEDFY